MTAHYETDIWFLLLSSFAIAPDDGTAAAGRWPMSVYKS
jgi:hypothetical protein